MIHELVVSDLGVIDELRLTLPPGMIALTGETGAGKTLLVDAIDLLMGGRADPGLVRPGSSEATVDGRFELDGEELVLSRVIPADGRSRAYINGRPATASALAEIGVRLLDLHGQHAHQSLLGVDAQRAALDLYGAIDLRRLEEAKARVAELDRELAELGGDERARAREIDLLRYQVDELDAADITDPDEEAELRNRADVLANAVEHEEAGSRSIGHLLDDDGARDRLALALAMIEHRGPFAEEAVRLRDLLAGVEDVADSIRSVAGDIEHDPEALAGLQDRLQVLQQMRRKYGDDLAEVMDEHRALAERLSELVDHEARAARIDADRAEAQRELAAAQAEVLSARTAAAPALAAAIEARLPDLAMPKAGVGIDVSGPDGSQVSFQLSANPGSPLQPLSKVASGGELARAMLALRSVLSEAPPVLVFDEVDAGIGGQAGFAVGRSLSDLGDRHQVLVVTHLPQVAAFADAHLAVEKRQGDLDTVSEIRLLGPKERVVEMARMLSGQPDSATAKKHARELMAEAAEQKAAARR
jgi:DNA repair protein RecN (Recombination protein N)